MNTETHNYFSALASVDVSNHVEKKGQFAYLSWPYAVSQLRLFDETATWEVKRFDGLPYLTTDSGTFVEVAVTVKGVTLSQIHPVLDARNKVILAPTAFDINTSIQRCLVKAIALHGLGLNVYAGEDLPHTETVGIPSSSTPRPKAVPKPDAKPAALSKSDNASTEPELLTPNQLRYLKRLIAETDTDESQLLGFFGFDDLEQIPKADVNRVIRMLEPNRHKEAA